MVPAGSARPGSYIPRHGENLKLPGPRQQSFLDTSVQDRGGRLMNVKEDDMNILKTAMLVVVLLLVPVYALPANLGSMRISLMQGDVQIKTTDAGDWGFASVNTPLAESD